MRADERCCDPCCTCLPYCVAAATSSSPSRGLWPHGFSRYTCFPAWRARIAIGACQWSGVAIDTTSTVLSSSARRKSSIAFGVRVCLLALMALPRTALSTSQRYATSELARREKCWASTVPRPFRPTTATTIVSLGERPARVRGRGNALLNITPRPAAPVHWRKSRRPMARSSFVMVSAPGSSGRETTRRRRDPAGRCGRRAARRNRRASGICWRRATSPAGVCRGRTTRSSDR